MESRGCLRPSLLEASEALEAAEGGLRKSMMTGGILVFLAACLLFLSASLLHAQAPTPFEEEERRAQLEQERAKKYSSELTQNIFFDWGGWTRLSYFNFDENPDVPGAEAIRRNLRDVDVRVWSEVGYKDIHDVYVRMRAEYLDWGEGENPVGTAESAWERPDLDQAFYTLHIDSLAMPGTDSAARSWHLSTTVGRQFIYLGTGMAYQQVNDGVVVQGNYKDLEYMGFAAKTQFPQKNIDHSPSVANNMNRYFFGGQVSYRIGNQVPYVFGLVQRDHSPIRPDEDPQDYHYNSEYIGVGIRGAILPTLGYFGEYVHEFGESFADMAGGPTNSRERIDADAANVGVRWLPDVWSHPRFEAQWTYGSGDSDRIRPSDTIGGNTRGTDDTSFNGFGFVLTGYSLAPIVTNIHVIRVGGAFHPFEKVEALKEFEFGTNYFNFQKAADAGGISDFRATTPSGDVGNEVDLYMNYRVFSDLTTQVRLGRFWTGSTYADGDGDHDSERDFFLVSMTLMF